MALLQQCQASSSLMIVFSRFLTSFRCSPALLGVLDHAVLRLDCYLVSQLVLYELFAFPQGHSVGFFSARPSTFFWAAMPHKSGLFATGLSRDF